MKGSTCSSASNQIRWVTVMTTIVVVGQLLLVQIHLWTPGVVVAVQQENNHLVLQSLPSSSSSSSNNNNNKNLTKTTTKSVIIINDTTLATSTRDLVFTTDDENNITQQQQQHTLQPLNNRSILFVHVGKAAGETIKNVLEAGCQSRKNKRRRAECLEQVPDSSLSRKVGGYFHCFSMRPRRFATKADAYLFNIRHPVDRAVSWYRYVHPAHCDLTKHDRSSPVCIAARQLRTRPTGWVAQFFGQCFPTAQAWAEAYSSSSSSRSSNNRNSSRSGVVTANDESANANATIATINCTLLAEQTFQGTLLNYEETPLAAHMIANYRHYASKTINKFPNKPVLLVRTHALWPDLKSLDKLLGGIGDFGKSEGSAVTHGSEHFVRDNNSNQDKNNNYQDNNSDHTMTAGKTKDNTQNDSYYLSPSATLQLCCALLHDILTYENLIQRAMNWNDTTKRSETQFLLQRCEANLQSMDELVQHCTK